MIKIIKAILYASWMHRKQFRRGTWVPYVFHPLEVGWLLYRCGFENALIVAGILHDTLEDTKADHRTIKRHFGPRVVAIVKCVSKNWATKSMMQAIRTYNPDIFNDAKIVKTCDVVANCNTYLRGNKNIREVTLEKYKNFLIKRGDELFDSMYNYPDDYLKIYLLVDELRYKLYI